ncbi:MAG TPA: hypothetical protein VHT97_15690 [Acidimicrobiales bacterium]|nr:hypothetical protein [Acidimicrobiales bacterium]
MTRRRSLTAALAFLGVIGVLLIPSASGAATVRRVRPPRTTTTTAAPVVVDDQAPVQADATPTADATPQPVVAAATLPGFQFPPFSFGGFTFPGFTFPPIQVPDFVALIFQTVLNTLQHTLCGIFGGTFCASP